MDPLETHFYSKHHHNSNFKPDLTDENNIEAAPYNTQTMDATNLRRFIVATLDPDANTRVQGELQLKHAADLPGFTDLLLSNLQNEQDINVALSTAVYLKNHISKGWPPSEDATKSIPEDEKSRFRNAFLVVLASSPPRIRPQLVPILQKILHHDFPERWPSFVETTIHLLNTNDAASINAGLQCLLAICRVYRFKSGENRTDFDKIVETTFPRLLEIGQGLINQMTEEAGEMLHIVLKAYKHATFVRWPEVSHFQGEMLTKYPVRSGRVLERTAGCHWMVHIIHSDCWKGGASVGTTRGYIRT